MKLIVSSLWIGEEAERKTESLAKQKKKDLEKYPQRQDKVKEMYEMQEKALARIKWASKLTGKDVTLEQQDIDLLAP